MSGLGVNILIQLRVFGIAGEGNSLEGEQIEMIRRASTIVITFFGVTDVATGISLIPEQLLALAVRYSNVKQEGTRSFLSVSQGYVELVPGGSNLFRDFGTRPW